MTKFQKNEAEKWFYNLRNEIRNAFKEIENQYAQERGLEAGKFKEKPWDREGGGGGVMSIMHGNVFEKVGVNISTVHGQFTPEFRKQIPGSDDSGNFYATGISIVAHMHSPLIPAVHFNTRYIETTKKWFGGGGDLTPMFEDDLETAKFHNAFKKACDKHNPDYYKKFKKQCDEYFYLSHRKESRGVGGIFFEYLSNDFVKDFEFTKDVGRAFLKVYPDIVKQKTNLPWTSEQREYQLIKRGRYVEFNLLYDRGTTFGLKTGGNIEAILMSMPPEVKWP